MKFGAVFADHPHDRIRDPRGRGGLEGAPHVGMAEVLSARDHLPSLPICCYIPGEFTPTCGISAMGRAMMSDQLNGRICVVWRGRDPYEDINSLADAAAATGELFDRDGVVVWLSDKGELVPAGGPVLREVIGRRVVTLRLVNRDGRLVREYRPFVVNDVALGMLLKAERRQDGSLLAHVPPIAPGRGCS
jgi:hypothetical protein